ncbi:MAG: hypothetical protein RIG77_23625 [Cyclobacteriaceae bacterium]
MEKLILTVKDNSKLTFLLELLKQLDFIEVQNIALNKKSRNSSYNLFDSAGLWKKRDVSAKRLREESWKRTH